jgi:hypothetical protein
MSYMNPLAALKPCVSGVMSAVASVTSAVTGKVSAVASAVFGVVSNIANRTANSVYPAFANSARCLASLYAKSPVVAVATGAATITGIAYVAYRTLQLNTSVVEEALEVAAEEVAEETASVSEEVVAEAVAVANNESAV